MTHAVSIVGLGKLGACMAACMAAKGIHVIGIDVNPETVTALRHGQAPTYEPGLAEMLATLKPHSLTITTDIREIELTDITFIVVPTPSEPNGSFSLRYVKEAAQGIGRVLRYKKGYHVVAVTSTVLPGSTQYGILPILERESGKKLGDFGLVYNPEFIALGTVIRDFLNPDFVLIGESDERAGDQVAGIYEQVCDSTWRFPIARMSIPSAELAKIGLNWMLVNKINAGNMFGQLAEKIPGANVDDVTKALGMDSRIGPKFLKAAMPASGPCLPRDALALKWLTSTFDVPSFLTAANERANSFRLDQLVREVIAATSKGATVAVLGLAYKPGTNVTDESPGFILAMKVAAHGFPVNVYDPLVTRDRAPHGLTDYCDNLSDAVRDAHVIVVANPDLAFADLGDCAGKIVIDPWRIVTGHDGADYRPFGIGATDEATEARLKKMWA